MAIDCSRSEAEAPDAAPVASSAVALRPAAAQPTTAASSNLGYGVFGRLSGMHRTTTASPPVSAVPRLLAGTRIASAIARKQLRGAVIRMLCDLDGADTVYFGKTTRRHAEDLFAFAERTARQAEEVDPSLRNIPLEERMAIVLFTRRIHIAANGALASERPLNEHEALYVRLLESGLNKLPSAPDMPVFRGMNVQDPSAVFEVGAIVTEPRFWCVSADRRVAFEPEGFGGNVLITFVGPVSAKILGPLAPGQSHREAIFSCNHRFQVLMHEVQRDEDGRLRHHVKLKDVGPF